MHPLGVLGRAPGGVKDAKGIHFLNVFEVHSPLVKRGTKVLFQWLRGANSGRGSARQDFRW